MKYIVMECCDSYAVLMDEQAVFVKAANLNYSVGQTVTSPIIMKDNEKTDRSRIKMISKIASAAASLVIVFGFGYNYYSNNYKAYATIYISGGSEYKVVLNKKNEVISVASEDKNGENILKNYNIKGKDKETVAVELIMLEKENGLITDGESVKVYMESDDKESSEKYSADIEKKISELNLNVNVTDNQSNGKVSTPVTTIVPDKDIITPPADVPVKPAEHAAPNEEHKPDAPVIPDNPPDMAHPELPPDENEPANSIPEVIAPITDSNNDVHKPEDEEQNENMAEPVPPPHDKIVSPDKPEHGKDVIKPTEAEHRNETPKKIPEKKNEKHEEKEIHNNIAS